MKTTKESVTGSIQVYRPHKPISGLQTPKSRPHLQRWWRQASDNGSAPQQRASTPRPSHPAPPERHKTPTAPARDVSAVTQPVPLRARPLMQRGPAGRETPGAAKGGLGAAERGLLRRQEFKRSGRAEHGAKTQPANSKGAEVNKHGGGGTR